SGWGRCVPQLVTRPGARGAGGSLVTSPEPHPLLDRWTSLSHPAPLPGRRRRPQSKIQNPKSEVDRLCAGLFLSPSAQETDDNLLFVRERLLKSEVERAGLLDLYGQVRAGRPVRLDDTNQLVTVLRLSGITRVGAPPRTGGPGCLWVRNRIYARVFDRAWIIQHMPDAELRRQREAYRRGLFRAAGVSAAVVAGTAGGPLSPPPA